MTEMISKRFFASFRTLPFVFLYGDQEPRSWGGAFKRPPPTAGGGKSRGPAGRGLIDGIRSALSDVVETPLNSVNLLGAPLRDDSLAAAVASATDLVRRLCTRLKHLDRHTAIFFLVHHVSAPRLLYLLRSAPLPKSVDELVRETLVEISNVDICGRSWEQAKLPISLGGLGVRSVEDLALPCHIASLHAALPLLRSISPGLFPANSTPLAL